MDKEKACTICGKSFTPKNRKQQCCSSECANKKAHESMKKYYLCQHCGKPFWKPNAFRMKYCSTECQRAAYALSHPKKEKPMPTVYKRTCPWCGKEFETTLKYQIYCNSTCTYQDTLKTKREQWAEAYVPRTYTCKECGTEFTTECGNKHSVFCCNSCSEKYERRHEHNTARHKEYIKKQKKQRETQLAQSFIEVVDYSDIFQRDNGICQICGMPVHPTKGIDNNWDGTIDHIVPLSIGGEHSVDNCQLAHRICNSLKCQETKKYTINWKEKASENNYWRIKYDRYKELMGA